LPVTVTWNPAKSEPKVHTVTLARSIAESCTISKVGNTIIMIYMQNILNMHLFKNPCIQIMHIICIKLLEVHILEVHILVHVCFIYMLCICMHLLCIFHACYCIFYAFSCIFHKYVCCTLCTVYIRDAAYKVAAACSDVALRELTQQPRGGQGSSLLQRVAWQENMSQ
jgi:hypothetical protein